MEWTACLISECTAPAGAEFTVNDNGIFTVYAVCAVHLAAIRNGSVFPEPGDPTLGLIGLRSEKPI
ncbi:hypothetical protein [Subtercola sp. RTI3]|uniref:hypothetical protein n=1 Tax=Subtercola sp. RTI3 TaxID=3048639 RepID=UPI002B239916|nr:hypothetical protein [Subtercola sp. RTI3]MEA9986073.1 hypothetical protein [Subtercola sp. RTI3]